MKSHYLLILGVLGLGLTGCGLFAGPPTQKVSSMVVPSPSHNVKRWMRVNTAAHLVELTIIAGYQDHGFNLNGTQNGAMQVTVPENYKVTIHFVNDSGLSNSLAVVAGARSRRASFSGAATRDLTTGLPPQGTQVFAFRPSRPGSYRMASLVPDHEVSGMWAKFVVTRGGKPSLHL